MIARRTHPYSGRPMYSGTRRRLPAPPTSSGRTRLLALAAGLFVQSAAVVCGSTGYSRAERSGRVGARCIGARPTCVSRV